MTTMIMRVRALGQAAQWMSHIGSGRMAQAPAGALRRRFEGAAPRRQSRFQTFVSPKKWVVKLTEAGITKSLRVSPFVVFPFVEERNYRVAKALMNAWK